MALAPVLPPPQRATGCGPPPCWQAETPTLAAGLALAQQADVLVGSHGAHLANAYMMRPGSSVIELTPHGFDDMGTAHANYAKKNLPVRG